MGLTHPISLCIVFSDRVADTCVACDQGGVPAGTPFFHIRRTLPWEKSIVRTVSHKREARDGRPGEEMTFITSLTDADEIVETIEKRWKIENGLHRFKTLCFTGSLTKNQIL